MAHAVALDLAALNVQRSRDHGLPGYNEWRVLCNLESFETFDELRAVISNHSIINKLQKLYGSVDKIDLWVAGILEDIMPGGLLGPTFQCLIAKQFKNLRDGDRFWYEYDGVFEPAQLTQIKRTSLAKVLCDNGDDIKHVQPDVFVRVNHISSYTSCDTLPSIDLRFWKECCSEHCHDSDRTFTISRNLNHLQRSKRRSSFDEENGNETADLYNEIKGENFEKKHNQVHCVDHEGNRRNVDESWRVNSCKTCVCKGLTTECETQVCPKLPCDDPQTSPDVCCPVCE